MSDVIQSRCCRFADTMGDYFRHWLRMQRNLASTPPIYHVNWFRKDTSGHFLWPGFSQNIARTALDLWNGHNRAGGKETPVVGCLDKDDIDWNGLDFPHDIFDELQSFDHAVWRKEVIGHEELFIELHDHLPPEMIYEQELLICRM